MERTGRSGVRHAEKRAERPFRLPAFPPCSLSPPRLVSSVAVTDCSPLIRDGYPWWLRPFLFRNVVAITLGRRIWIASGVQGEARERLLRHERTHVDQMCRLGIPRFLFRYLREYLVNRLHGLSADEAYRRISFEAEAFAAEEGRGEA